MRQTYAGDTRLVLSSLRAEMEAVTRALGMLAELSAPPCTLFIVTDSQLLLRRLEARHCPPEWLERTWLYCLGRSGVVINEQADRLVGTSEVTDRIYLGPKDIATSLVNNSTTHKTETRNATGSRTERELDLQPGWTARSRSN